MLDKLKGMMMRYVYLSEYPNVFRAMTGLHLSEFDELIKEILPQYAEAERARLSRPGRRRDIGAGHPFALSDRDHILLTVVWLRVYPTQEVLGYLFGVSDSAARSAIERVLPVLEAAGRDTMRLPDPGRKRRRKLDDLLHDTPELAVVIDTFEQRVQRPRDKTQADTLYSGKKKAHTLKSQVAVDEETGQVVDVAPSVAGPTADLTLLAQSTLMDRLPNGVGGIGDLAYVGIDKLGNGAAPRRKPRGQARPPDDVRYNTAFSKRRLIVEHTIGRMRRYQALSQTDRHHRHHHTSRVRAVAGLVNRQFAHRLPC
jgi:DDE superfamily endonuclease/Helix-turn-helix of DDE superfamily endonuclease